MKTAIITGASSGIGFSLTEILLKKNFKLGLMARRTHLLEPFQQNTSSQVFVQGSDFTDPVKALEDFKILWDQLGSVDYVFLNAGVSLSHQRFSWQNDRDMLQVNAVSWTALAGESIKRFLKQGSGHLVGVSSIAGVRGNGKAPVYGATKAYISNYLQGVRQQIKVINPAITITDIRPGFVATEMIRSSPMKFWVSPPYKAASQILEAVRKKKRVAYISRRWLAAAWLYALLPEFILERIYARYLHQSL